MNISIRSESFKMKLWVPLVLGSVAIRFIPKKYMKKQEKKMMIQVYKRIRKTLKHYKGLTIVEVYSHTHEQIIIKI